MNRTRPPRRLVSPRGRHPRLRPRLAGSVAALGLTVTALVATAPPAAAAPQPMGRCTTSSGAVLAVDFSDWGGPILRSCGTTPTTGYELLNQGGWRTTGTGHDGPAFICRIGYSGFKNGRQFPTAAEDDCVLTPPASAYWSYWHADPGKNDWEYSQLGAMLYKPKPGSVDLWIFGGTNVEGTEGRPTVRPDQLRARNANPTGDAAKPPSEQKAPPLPPDVDTGPRPDRPETKAPGHTTTEPDEPKRSPSKKPKPRDSPEASPSTSAPQSAAATPSPGSAEVVDAAPAADAPHDTGSVAPVVAGAALVVLIGGTAAFVARRRRRIE
ncbi:hypothetical protein ACIQAC_32820 [Streptomyces sp. NPDC088387]|uniref:hypothetical protein n=1 Tax=Streptomyces sp. NPDC088387 TaxID=3365859 RepID=UPI0037FD41FB